MIKKLRDEPALRGTLCVARDPLLEKRKSHLADMKFMKGIVESLAADIGKVSSARESAVTAAKSAVITEVREKVARFRESC